MVKIDDIKAKARAGLSAARRGLASGAKATGLRARALGRRASAAASRRRRSYCAATAAPPGHEQILKVTNEAIQAAAKRSGLTLPRVDDASGAIRVGKMLTARKDRLSRLAGEAALHVGYALASNDEKEWGEAGMYADDDLDEARK